MSLLVGTDADTIPTETPPDHFVKGRRAARRSELQGHNTDKPKMHETVELRIVSLQFNDAGLLELVMAEGGIRA